MKQFKYYAAALTAFITWGFFSLVLRPLSAFNASDILCYRVYTSIILMALFLLLFKRKTVKDNLNSFRQLTKAEKRKFVGINIGGGALLTANWFTFIYAMNHATVRSTSLAYLICPILTTVLAYFILKEKLKLQQWLAVCISVIGCLLLSLGHFLEMSYSVIVALTYALYLILQKQNKGFDKVLVLFIQILFAGILLMPYFLKYSGTFITDIKFHGFIVVIAVFFTIVPLLLNLFALKGINSSTVGMLLNINPIIAFVLSAVYFHEKTTTTQLIAFGLVFLAVLIFNVKFKKKEEVSLA